MNVSPGFSSVCRACNQRQLLFWRVGSRSPADSPQRVRQIARAGASTRTFASALISSTKLDSSTEAPPIPPPTPGSPSASPESGPAPGESSSSSSTTLNSFYTSPTVDYSKLTTATITRLHARTAHATRNIQYYDTYLRKHYTRSTHELVHDPYDILRVGDVIRYGPFTPTEQKARTEVKEGIEAEKLQRAVDGLPKNRRGAYLVGARKPKSKRGGVRFIVREVVSPFGESIEQRAAAKAKSPDKKTSTSTTRSSALPKDARGTQEGSARIGKSILSALHKNTGSTRLSSNIGTDEEKTPV